MVAYRTLIAIRIKIDTLQHLLSFYLYACVFGRAGCAYLAVRLLINFPTFSRDEFSVVSLHLVIKMASNPLKRPADEKKPAFKRFKPLSTFRSPLTPQTPPAGAKVLKKTPAPAGHPSANSAAETSEEVVRCYSAVYRKRQQKKNKTWEGDGIVVMRNSKCVLLDMQAKELGKVTFANSDPLSDGCPLSIGRLEAEVGAPIPWENYISGKCFVKQSFAAEPKKIALAAKTFKSLFSGPKDSSASASVTTPRHSPDAPDALVMPRPKDTASRKRNVMDVVVDPYIARHLRAHQRLGVTFLYECVNQMKDYEGAGAILADEMGLGKTVQTIALLWTLLKQSSHVGVPPLKRALVVCPASLVINWKNEFKKWLGDQRIQVMAITTDSEAAQSFNAGRIYQVLVIGYEKMRSCFKTIQEGNFDIVVCDEGHRLKNAQMRTSQALNSIKTRRRVILSGTPIQNDLGEFYAMVDFVNPGLLGTAATFRKVYEEPIKRSREPGCNTTELELGQARAAELSRLTELFVLRRTSEVNSCYLPAKHEMVLFVRPTPTQTAIYKHVVRLYDRTHLTDQTSTMSNALKYITVLKKLVNSPTLLSEEETEGFEHKLATENMTNSGKMDLLVMLLHEIRTKTEEKVVIVSNWTQTLDLIERLCEQKGYDRLRLDGSTAVQNRQDLVDKFNSNASCFIFLLSSKAGGVGLNLVGASRLILFDIDWNPSICQQAMARIWRDGQRRPVKIYRFLSTGTIEERIYQRQLTKLGLSDSIIDQKATEGNGFTVADLKNIFKLESETECLTHDLVGCSCSGRKALPMASAIDCLAQLQEWSHIPTSGETPTGKHEELAAADCELGNLLQRPETSSVLSFIFHRVFAPAVPTASAETS
ncbi:Rad54b protein [Fimicolochytrium jonesii]|uniref:Rad54b protein n=1 Tax=Fimicolochytrium jonesii TaxID=1396493 RepID=UPI0022FE32A6|nr:Rad54b protein [Fimicolochytrium jonesii]KAI8824145.1 Rad54b protein [Fimicolochytrium jonesii]